MIMVQRCGGSAGSTRSLDPRFGRACGRRPDAGPVTRVRSVRASGMMARLSAGDRDDLIALGRPRRYPPGRVLFGQGDRSNHVVLITSGTVKVFCTTEDGREPLLGVRHEGDLVGELAAIDDNGE